MRGLERKDHVIKSIFLCRGKSAEMFGVNKLVPNPKAYPLLRIGVFSNCGPCVFPIWVTYNNANADHRKSTRNQHAFENVLYKGLTQPPPIPLSPANIKSSDQSLPSYIPCSAIHRYHRTVTHSQ